MLVNVVHAKLRLKRGNAVPKRDLNSFIKALEARGELRRVKTLVSPVLEITEIADRVGKQGGPALLFERVEGSDFPVLIGALGSEGRMSLALGVEDFGALERQLEGYLDLSRYTTLRGLLSSIPFFWRMFRSLPVRVPLGRPPCQEVIEHSPNLGELPILKCWPLDGGRFLTLPVVFTKELGARTQNAGMYRMQVLDRATTAMHWHKHKDGSQIFESYRKAGKRMPVAVALGCDPAITYSCTAPLPPGVDEMLLAGFLRRRPVSLVRCRSCDLWVPRDAQFVLEGYVDPLEPLCREGPFGDHTGYYSLEGLYPRFHLTCLTRRKTPIYPATVVGRPPMEDCYLAKATERLFLPILRKAIPQLCDLCLPLEGVFHGCAVLSVKNDFPGAAQTVMNAVWGMGQLRYTKLLIAVDEGTDPSDRQAVLKAVLQNVEPGRDLTFSKGTLDALDHSSPTALFGTRLGVDATAKPQRPTRLGRMEVTAVDKREAGQGLCAALRLLDDRKVKLAVAVDRDVDVRDLGEVLWRIYNNIDAGRDLAVQEGGAALDATRKREDEGLHHPWPADIEMDGEVRRRVTRRWKEYGF